MGCSYSKNPRKIPGYEEPAVLAAETHFNVDEVEGLYDLFMNISSSIVDDGVIQKEEFQLAIFRDRTRRNLFADRIFDMIDFKRNGVIEFGEFVRSLSVFHPAAPMAEKIECAYNFYDVRHTGFIEKEELKVMVLAMLHESELELEDDMVDAIVNKTFDEADTKDDGKIDPDEWNVFVLKHPSTINRGNLIHLQWYEQTTNLHHVWDDLIIDSAMETYYNSDFTTMIQAIQSNLMNGTYHDISYWDICDDIVCPEPFADESIKLACQYAYKNVTPGSTLGDEYFKTRLPIVEKRLAQGGIRLAALLNRIFDPSLPTDDQSLPACSRMKHVKMGALEAAE